jgi:hypothetical protein
MRDLVRARLDAVRALRRARQQLSGFLLRQGCHYGRPAWTKLHRRWLAGLKFEQAVHHRDDHDQAVSDFRVAHRSCANHSFSFDHRRRPETLRTAMATAFFWPTRTTRRFPRVMPV